MKNEYKKPTMTVVWLAEEDIFLLASGEVETGGGGTSSGGGFNDGYEGDFIT